MAYTGSARVADPKETVIFFINRSVDLCAISISIRGVKCEIVEVGCVVLTGFERFNDRGEGGGGFIVRRLNT